MLEGITPSQRVKSLLLGLLREISLTERQDSTQKEQFFIGNGEQRSLLGSGMGVTWWHTNKSSRLNNALAKAVRERLRSTVIVERGDVKAAVSKALRDNELNKLVPFSPRRTGTLFDVYNKVGAEQTVAILWRRICAQIEAAIDDWLFVYPLRNLTVPSCIFETERAWILSRDNTSEFERFCDDFDSLRQLSLRNGMIESGIKLSDDKTPSWLFIRSSGTNLSVFAEATQHASMLLGLLLSFHRHDAPLAFAVSAAQPIEHVAIFSSQQAKISFSLQICGPLLHAVMGDTTITSATIERVNAWLREKVASPLSLRSRGSVAARWINQAAAARAQGRFLFFFFALDALFGERFQVEEKIVEGVTHALSLVSGQKCRWLFDLRSELVHGGAASVNDWTRIEKYRDHFHSEPERDIEVLATACLLKFFSTSGGLA